MTRPQRTVAELRVEVDRLNKLLQRRNATINRLQDQLVQEREQGARVRQQQAAMIEDFARQIAELRKPRLVYTPAPSLWSRIRSFLWG